MLITNFSYCEMMREEMGKNVIVNPFTMLVPYSVPTNFSFFITIGVHDIPQSGAKFQFEFISPSGEKILAQEFSIPQVVNLSDQDKAGVQLNMGLQNVILKETGVYKTTLSHEGILLGEYPIEVIPSVKH